jgi:hypothetical protein
MVRALLPFPLPFLVFRPGPGKKWQVVLAILLDFFHPGDEFPAMDFHIHPVCYF